MFYPFISQPRYLLTSLASNDLAIGLFVTPFGFLPALYHCWPYGEIFCQIQVSSNWISLIHTLCFYQICLFQQVFVCEIWGYGGEDALWVVTACGPVGYKVLRNVGICPQVMALHPRIPTSTYNYIAKLLFVHPWLLVFVFLASVCHLPFLGFAGKHYVKETACVFEYHRQSNLDMERHTYSKLAAHTE